MPDTKVKIGKITWTVREQIEAQQEPVEVSQPETQRSGAQETLYCQGQCSPYRQALTAADDALDAIWRWVWGGSMLIMTVILAYLLATM